MTDEVRRARAAFFWVGVIVPLGILVLAAAVIIAWMPQLPDPIATHWGSDGVDGFSPKWAYVPFIVGIGAGVVILDASLALFAHRMPQSSMKAAVGPWSSTTRLMAAVNLGVAVMVAFLAVVVAAMQRGLSDAADAPDIGGWTALGLALLAGFTAIGWFVQPKSPVVTAEQGQPAGRIPIAVGERAAWFGTASMARSGVIVLVSALALLVVMTVSFLALGEDGWWILLLEALLIMFMIGSMVIFNVRVNVEGLRVRSLLGWPNTRIPLDRIERVETVSVDPFREFGGWGWRLGMDGRRGVVLRAGEALQVTQSSGRVFVVTIDGASDAAAALDTLRSHAATD